VSYRSFKHLLGETSLERRCRLSIGLVIVVLVSTSFFWYGQRIANLLKNQNIQAARMLVGPALMELHDEALDKRLGPVRDASEVESSSFDDVSRHKARGSFPLVPTIRRRPRGTSSSE
jgi:two-component system, NarL family, sensor histidine kinase BarA